MPLTQEQALRAYATMMNTLDASALEPLLAEDFHYASQWVFAEITSKAEYLDYIVPKLETLRRAGVSPWAEMARLDHEIPGPCVVMASPEAGSISPARWANHTLNQSHSSVIVPTVERDVRTELPWRIATEGRTFSAASRSGAGSSSRNWRT